MLVVFVLTVITSTLLNNTVDLVPSNVPPVLKKLSVSFALITPEMTELFVTVKMVSMKTELKNVQLVKINVTCVLTVHLTVQFASMEESILHHVLSHHQPLKLLELTMSQLVLLKLLSVTTDVLLVKELLKIVKLVMLIDPTHQLVSVTLDSMKKIKNVNIVHTNVSLVTV
jgi:hypothetical protein